MHSTRPLLAGRVHLYSILILFAAILLPFAPARTLAQAPTNPPAPGEPPVAPIFVIKEPPGQAAAAGCTQPNCVYLPYITRNGSSSELDRATSLSYYQDYYLPGNTFSIGWTGSIGGCNAGDTSAAFKDLMLKRINYFRLAAGVPVLTGLNATYNAAAQQAALMMSAQDDLSHSPGTSWACYTATGASAAGKSDLYLGSYGPGAISGYIRDPGSTNTALGHRRWILVPQTKQMGTGDVPASSVNGKSYRPANALYVITPDYYTTRPATRSAFVAWPPAGYIPYTVVYPRWSFSYPLADFSDASVTLSQNGKNIPVTKYPVVNGIGDYTLAWGITSMGDYDNWAKPAADTSYTVTITGVMVQGINKNFSYTVIIFDPGP